MDAENLCIAGEIIQHNDAAWLHLRFDLAKAGDAFSEGIVQTIDDHHNPLAPSESQVVTGAGAGAGEDLRKIRVALPESSHTCSSSMAVI